MLGEMASIGFDMLIGTSAICPEFLRSNTREQKALGITFSNYICAVYNQATWGHICSGFLRPDTGPLEFTLSSYICAIYNQTTWRGGPKDPY